VSLCLVILVCCIGELVMFLCRPSARRASVSDVISTTLIQTRRLRFFGHVAWMGDSPDMSRALYTSIRGLPKDWRRRPGRPRRTWLRTMEADLQPLNHGLNSAWRLDRSGPRTMEATCGNGYAPVRGTPAMMTMMTLWYTPVMLLYVCQLDHSKNSEGISMKVSNWFWHGLSRTLLDFDGDPASSADSGLPFRILSF